MLSETVSTNEKIMKATYKLLQTEGAEKTTTKKIAAEAGVNEVTIFRNFENKQKLIEATKEFYINSLIEKLNEYFEYDEEESVEDYLDKIYLTFAELPDEDFGIIRIAMVEIKETSEKKLLILRIINAEIDKLAEFFEIKMEKGEIRDDVNPRYMAINTLGALFQTVVLSRLYDSPDSLKRQEYSKFFFDIFFNGVKP